MVTSTAGVTSAASAVGLDHRRAARHPAAVSVPAAISVPAAATVPLLVHTGHLGSTSYRAQVAPYNSDDLLVAYVVNSTLAGHVTAVLGGGAVSWAPAGGPFYDGVDSRVLQIW
jgi:hypothetical protein